MPRNGSGVYSLPAGSDGVSGTTIQSSKYNAAINDIKDALTESLPRNGSAAMTADLPMGGFKITGMAAGSASGEAVEYAQMQSTISQSVASSVRNRLINGCMQVSQENGTTAVTTNGAYPADQWTLNFAGTGFAVSAQRVASTTLASASHRLRFTVTTAKTSLATGDALWFQQPLEGQFMADAQFGVSGAKQLLYRFMFKAPAGTYHYAATNYATNRTFIGSFTVESGDANIDKLQTVIISGDTTGSWPIDNAGWGFIRICLGGGSTYQGASGWQSGNLLCTSSQFNGLGSVSNVFEFGDAGLYIDRNSAGIFPYFEMPEYHAEEIRCMRYWEKLVAGITESGGGYLIWPFKTRKRATPTYVLAGGGAATDVYPNTDFLNVYHTTTVVVATGTTVSARL